MVGQRDRNLRMGHVAEDLGVVLFKGFAAVAQVPGPDDCGVDVVATLLRRADSRKLVAEDSFYVQFKAASRRVITYEGDEVRWLTNLKLPLFIGSVDLATAEISLYTTHRVSQVLLEMAHQRIDLHLDPHNEWTDPPSGLRSANIRPPVLRWTAERLVSADFAEQAYSVLKSVIECEQRNIRNRPIRFLESLKWETGQPPVASGYMMLGSSVEEAVAVFQELVPFVHVL